MSLISPPERVKFPAEVSTLHLGAFSSPVVVISVSPVVSVTAVLVIRSLSGQVVGSIAPRAVGVHVPPVTVMVVLVPVLLIWMVPVAAPRRIVAATIVELSFPLPVSSVCGKQTTVSRLQQWLNCTPTEV